MIYRYFLAFWIFTSSIVAVQSTQYGLLGETVTFKTDITDPPDDILWKHNGNKVVHFDGSKQISYSLFENRVAVDWHSAELEVNHLTHSDSGQYEMDAAYKGRVIRLNYELRVLDRVTKPTIICHMMDGSSSDKSGSEATLMCSTNTSQSLNYEWSQPGKNQSGQILTIPLGTEHDDKVYSCTVSNRLSKEMATFTAKDCYPVGVSAGLIAGLVIGGIVLLLCVLGAVFCALKHKEEKTDENQQPHSDYASDQPSQPLLHRTETRPSSQRLRNLEETVNNSNYDHKDEKHNELDPQTEKGLENNEGKPEKIGPPVPKKPHLSKVNQGQADVNDDDLQSPTASEKPGLENNKAKPNTIKPAVPKKPPSVKISKGQTDSNPPSKDKVSEVGCFEEHSGATESDLQSFTAAQKPVVGEEVNSQQVTGEKQENESVEMTKKKEPPTIPEPTGLENNEGKPEKIGPPVAKKPHLSKVNQGQADVNDDDLQSPTASEKPDGI